MCVCEDTIGSHMMKNSEQEEPIVRHHYKDCKRGHGCARALHRHMMSHSTDDVDIEHGGKHLLGKLEHKPAGGNKHSYFLRNNANNRFVSYRAIEDQGRCSSSIAEEWRNLDDHGTSSEEEEDLANCLVMLSNKSVVLPNEEEDKAKQVSKAKFQCKACNKVFNSHQALGGHRASHKKVKGCFAAKLDNNLLGELNHHHEYHISTMDAAEASMPDLINQASSQSTRKAKAHHECSICRRVFSSGQALGGHKRCHWLTQNAADKTFIPSLHHPFQYDHDHQLFKKPMIEKPESFDLNFPPAFLTIGAPGQ